MIEFTRYLLKRAKDTKIIPFNDFLAIARGKEGKLLDFFLSIKGTELVEYTENGLKVVATQDELKAFKKEVYKRCPPFIKYKNPSVFDINRKAKKFTPLSLLILEYIKNNAGCELTDLQNEFASKPNFREAHTFLINEDLVLCSEGEFFVCIQDREYQILLNNLKSLGITVESARNEDEKKDEEATDTPAATCKIIIEAHEFVGKLLPNVTPERLIYSFYMNCSLPQGKVFLRGKKAYMLSYANLLDKEKSFFRAIINGKRVDLQYGVNLNEQLEEKFLVNGICFEANFVIKSFGANT